VRTQNSLTRKTRERGFLQQAVAQGGDAQAASGCCLSISGRFTFAGSLQECHMAPHARIVLLLGLVAVVFALPPPPTSPVPPPEAQLPEGCRGIGLHGLDVTIPFHPSVGQKIAIFYSFVPWILALVWIVMTAVFRTTQLLLGVLWAAIVVCTVRIEHAPAQCARSLSSLISTSSAERACVEKDLRSTPTGRHMPSLQGHAQHAFRTGLRIFCMARPGGDTKDLHVLKMCARLF
jgi:hypothetical protein